MVNCWCDITNLPLFLFVFLCLSTHITRKTHVCDLPTLSTMPVRLRFLHPTGTSDGSSNLHDFDALQNLVYQAKHDVRDTLAALQLKKDELDKLEKELGSILEVIEKNQNETLATLEAERDKQVCIHSLQS